MKYSGHYINLDRSIERRGRIEEELARHKLGYSRFAAVEGNGLNLANPKNLQDGILGCFASHCGVLKRNAGSDRHLHIIEDDVVFADCAEQAINWAIDTGKLDNCDILFTDVSVPVLNDTYKMYRTMYRHMVAQDGAGQITRVDFNVFSLRGVLFAAAASYLVNRRSIAKLTGLCEAAMAKGVDMPFDIFLRKKCESGEISIGCLFPFVTSVAFESMKSSVTANLDELSAITRLIGRRCFFVGNDQGECKKYIDDHLRLPELDMQAQILAHLLAFSLTDSYVMS